MPTLFTRDFFLPAAELCAEAHVAKNGVDVVYSWAESHNGVPSFYAKGFCGKVSKPKFFYRYSKVDQRDAKVVKFLEDSASTDAYLAGRKIEKKAASDALNAKEDMPVGTVLVRSGGYEQTNVSFFKVIGHFGRLGVQIVDVASKRDETQVSNNSMSDHCLPDLEHVGTAISKARMSSKSYINLDRDLASVWDGRPQYRSWYA